MKSLFTKKKPDTMSLIHEAGAEWISSIALFTPCPPCEFCAST